MISTATTRIIDFPQRPQSREGDYEADENRIGTSHSGNRALISNVPPRACTMAIRVSRCRSLRLSTRETAACLMPSLAPRSISNRVYSNVRVPQDL